MISGNEIEEIRIDPENGRWVSRTELITLEGVTERTITNRIKSGYYKSRLTSEGNREIFLPRKTLPEMVPETFQEDSGNVTGIDGNLSIQFPDQERKQPKEDPETTLKVIEAIERAQDRADAYAKELMQAREERGYYRAITDTHTRTEEALKKEIFERDAKIKQLEQQLLPDIELQAKVKQLEAQLHELDSKHQEALQKYEQELQAMKEEKEVLAGQLEAEKRKSGWGRLFGR